MDHIKVQILFSFQLQLMQNLRNLEVDDDFEIAFPGMVSCHLASCNSRTWIVDFGASDHITIFVDILTDVKVAIPISLLIFQLEQCQRLLMWNT